MKQIIGEVFQLGSLNALSLGYFTIGFVTGCHIYSQILPLSVGNYHPFQSSIAMDLNGEIILF